MNNKSYLPFPSHCVWGNFIGTWYSYNTAFKDLLFDVLITRMHWPLVLVHNALSQINNNFPSQVSHKTRSEIYFSISKIFKSLSTSGGWHVFQSHYSGSLASSSTLPVRFTATRLEGQNDIPALVQNDHENAQQMNSSEVQKDALFYIPENEESNCLYFVINIMIAVHYCKIISRKRANYCWKWWKLPAWWLVAKLHCASSKLHTGLGLIAGIKI